MSAALMIQGCGSNVGKSTLVAGLCRLFTDRGVRMRPFKPQNMSNNAAVTRSGGEIGRAQAVQAQACRVAPSVHMNPILLKPQSDVGAQLVVRGKMQGAFSGRDFAARKPQLLDLVIESFRTLQEEADFVLVEGAGSPAEINLRPGDIANMGFARAADVPVALVGDIDRGHVIAALAGAHRVLDPEDRAMIRGFIINKFRGDPALFTDGRREIFRFTGWPDLGVVPWLAAANRLPAEDALALNARSDARSAKVKVVAPLWRSIANFDEFDSLRHEEDVAFSFVPPGRPLPGDADLVVLPGSKSTLADLATMRSEGWDIDLLAHARRGGRVLGVCGGFQMLGRSLVDPEGVDGPPGRSDGLGLLDVETVMTGTKRLTLAKGRFADGGALFGGYEMHVGVTTGADLARPLLIHDDGRPDGARSRDERIAGTYVHGLFDSAAARAPLLRPLGVRTSLGDRADEVDAALDQIAAALADNLDVDAIARIAGL